jgi:hypothetical protein
MKCLRQVSIVPENAKCWIFALASSIENELRIDRFLPVVGCCNNYPLITINYLMIANRAKSAFASSVLPAAWSFW